MKILWCIFISALLCLCNCAQVHAQKYPEAIPDSTFHSEGTTFAHGRIHFYTIGGKARADFDISNDTSGEIDFTAAQYSALGEDGSKYKLKFYTVWYNTNILNPNVIPAGGDPITIFCYSPVSPAKTKLKGISILLKDGRQIKFVPE